jgi:hypothetical protein
MVGVKQVKVYKLKKLQKENLTKKTAKVTESDNSQK